MDFIKLTQKLAQQSKHIKRFQDALQAPERITVVAHRGGPEMGTHENTMAAFEKAIECGADMIETDLRRTRDGVIICHHDAHIGREKIADISYAEANKLAKQKGYEIPHLRSLLTLAHGRIQLDLELKEVGYELDVIDQVRDMLKPDAFVMKSFNDSTVYTIKEIDPRIVTGLLVENKPFNNKPMDTIAKLSYEARMTLTKADFLGPEVSLTNKALVTRMHLLGKKIFVWTPNSDIEIQHLIGLGVDAIITDCPDKALLLLNR
jgi:glycerophosphoryl diester phosphodiesterase